MILLLRLAILLVKVSLSSFSWFGSPQGNKKTSPNKFCASREDYHNKNPLFFFCVSYLIDVNISVFRPSVRPSAERGLRQRERQWQRERNIDT